MNFVLYSVTTFSLPVKQQGVWKVTNDIASALYRDRTDLIRILAFSNTACCMQCNPDPLIEMYTTIGVTSYYLCFPNLNKQEVLNIVGSVWSWSGVTQEGHSIFRTFSSFGQR